MVEKVIIADDDPYIRGDYIKRIQNWTKDVSFIEVGDGASLVNKVRDESSQIGKSHGGINLILTDYRMPMSHRDEGVNGLQAIELIRRFDKSTPIVMLTDSNVANEALEAGANRYIDRRSRNFLIELREVVLQYL